MTDDRENIARLSMRSCGGDSYIIALSRPLGGPEGGAWLLECETAALYAGARRWRRSLGAGYAAHLLQDLAAARIPVIPEYIMGCDGVDYELTVMQGFNTVTYRWWCGAPKGYEPLLRFGNELLGVAGINDRLTTMMSDNRHEEGAGRAN